MNKKLQRIMLVLGLGVSLLFMAGCKEDDEETPPPPDPLVGQWNATNPQDLGFTEFRYFINSDLSYRNFWHFETDHNEIGTWQKLQPDSIRYTPQTLDGQTPPYGVYTYKYTLSNSNNDLTLTIPNPPNPAFNVLLQRVP